MLGRVVVPEELTREATEFSRFPQTLLSASCRLHADGSALGQGDLLCDPGGSTDSSGSPLA